MPDFMTPMLLLMNDPFSRGFVVASIIFVCGIFIARVQARRG